MKVVVEVGPINDQDGWEVAIGVLLLLMETFPRDGGAPIVVSFQEDAGNGGVADVWGG